MTGLIFHKYSPWCNVLSVHMGFQVILSVCLVTALCTIEDSLLPYNLCSSVQYHEPRASFQCIPAVILQIVLVKVGFPDKTFITEITCKLCIMRLFMLLQ